MFAFLTKDIEVVVILNKVIVKRTKETAVDRFVMKKESFFIMHNKSYNIC